MIPHSPKLFILAAALLILAGCKDPYGACVKADQDIAQSINSGFVTIMNLEQQGLISPAEALSAAGYLEFANKADEAFGTCAATAHTSGSVAGSFTACAAAFNTSLNNPQQLALIHISNPQASANISAIVKGLGSAVGTITSALGGQ